MATNDLIPFVLSDQTEEFELPGEAWDRAVIAPRILKTGILFVTAAAIVFAVLSEGTPSVLFANATALLVGTSAPQDGTAQSMPTIQPTADAQALPPTASKAPTREEIAAAFKTASQSETEIRQPPAEALKQFQAWAAEDDAQVRPEQPVQPVQDALAQVLDDQAQAVQNARAQVRPVQKHRHVKPVHHARAKIRPVKNARAKMRREQIARAQVRPVQNTQAQVQPVQNARPQWLLQSLGLMD